MTTKRLPLFGFLAALSCLPAVRAIEIEIRYDYDTNGFFTAHPEAKALLRKVADHYEALLTDTLLPIDPAAFGAGNTWKADFYHPGNGNYIGIPNLVVPTDTLIVYAGGRNLGGPAGQGGPGGFSGLSATTQEWIDTVVGRGQAGALVHPRTDFGPWGGSITFNTAETWDFSLNAPEDDASPFVSIALHEFGHLLGIGTSQSWIAKASGGHFTGPHAAAVFGGNVPLTGDGYHWREDEDEFGDPVPVPSKAYGEFGILHGLEQDVLMNPTIHAGGFLKVMTDLDLAALRDIGWQVAPPPHLSHGPLHPSESPFTFTWPSTSGLTYRLQRSTELTEGDWATLSTQTGNGDMQQHVTPATGDPRIFYRLTTTLPAGAALMARTAFTGSLLPVQPAVLAEGCGCSPAEDRD